jgi:hypothetical protein
VHYALQNDDALFIVASDSYEEFSGIGQFLAKNNCDYVKFTPEEAKDILSISGIQHEVYAIEPDYIPENVIPIDETGVQYQLIKMNSSIDDLSAAMFDLYAEKHNVAGPRSTIQISLEELCFNGEWSFGCSFHPDYGALIAISTEDFMDETDSVPLQEYEHNARIGTLVSLPFDATEILPGLFTCRIDPLAARKQLLSSGFVESDDVVKFLHKRFGAWPFSSTKAETEDAIGVGGLLPSDFTFQIDPQAEVCITRVIIKPNVDGVQNLDIVFMSPLLKHILPIGFSEIEPTVFEIFQKQAVAIERLVTSGLIETQNKSRRATKQRKPKDKPTPVSILDDWEVVLSAWHSLSDIERVIALPDDMISFCVLNSGNGETFLFVVPRGFFNTTNELFKDDLFLEERLMKGVEKVGPNIFKVTGFSQINLTATMIANGFHESEMLIFTVNNDLYSSNLSEQIGFDLG